MEAGLAFHVLTGNPEVGMKELTPGFTLRLIPYVLI